MNLHRASFFTHLVLLLAGIACACSPPCLRADIGVVVADPTNIGAAAYTHAGHAMVYLSNVCAETPVRARLCAPGEQGSFITIFPNFREQRPYEWNIVPVSLVLDGSAEPGNRLLFGSRTVKLALSLQARTAYFRDVCRDACPQARHAYWRDLVATTIDRDLFIYAVHTTAEQDRAAVEWINSRPNVNHYNGLSRNCAGFVRSLVNSLFPAAIHRDLLNDFGLMSPKAAARSFAHWAQQRPDLGFYCVHLVQKPSSIPRTATASSGTEAAVHIKKYLLPALLFADADYFLTGRFNLYKESVRYATPGLSLLQSQRRAEARNRDEERLFTTRHEIAEQQADVTGTSQEWENYRRRFAAFSEAAGVLGNNDRAQLLKLFDHATASVDDNGNVWLALPQNAPGNMRHLGIDDSNILSPRSDPELAFDLMVWRVGYSLQAKPRMRPRIHEFREDWDLLQETYEKWRPAAAEENLAGDRHPTLTQSPSSL